MGVAKVTFIPHHTNNHWPLALRHRTLAYVSSFLILTKIVAISALALTPHTAELSTITESTMVALTNQARTQAGLPALSVSNSLTQAAKLKGQDMLKNQYFAHISPSGVTPWFWMKKTNYTYEVAGENLAIDFLDGEDVISAWLASPTHKANMLHTEYTQTGIAVVSGEFQGGTSIIVVHMFGKPLAEVVTEPTADTSPVPTPPPAPIVAGITKPISTPLPSPTPIPKYTIALSPAFDRQQIAIVGASSVSPWQLFSLNSPIAINASVIHAIPTFTIQENKATESFVATIIHSTRQVTLLILLTVAFLLTLAILVRIRVQHPALIAHASLVVFLATILLLY